MPGKFENPKNAENPERHERPTDVLIVGYAEPDVVG